MGGTNGYYACYFFNIICYHPIYHSIQFKIITSHFHWYNLFPAAARVKCAPITSIYSSEPDGAANSAISFSFLWEKINKKDSPQFLCLAFCLWDIQTDALEETREGRNQSQWVSILLTMLSLGESQAVSNGLRLEQEARIWITAPRGSHILLWVRNAATWAIYLVGQ